MLQTTLSVPLEVKPESCSRLSTLIDTVKRREDVGRDPQSENFARVITLVPCLHFMSMSVFPAADYDPIFILEANFDGAPGPFWGQLEAVLGEDLRAMLRCCKRPLDGTGTLYDAVTALGSRAPVAPFLEQRTQQPSVFHHGNRGLSCPQIRDDYALFLAARGELDRPAQANTAPYRGLQPAALHAALRAALLPGHPWLNEPAPARISPAENRADWARMIGFALTLMLVLSSPGLLLAALVPWRFDLLIMVALAFGLSLLIYLNRRGLQGTEIKTRFKLSEFLIGQTGKLVAAGALYLIVPTLLLAAIVAPASGMLHYYGIGKALGFSQALGPSAHVVFFGLIGLLLMSAPLLLLLVRLNEMQDSSQDGPHTNERTLRDMYRREDWIQQNHMGSIVLIKPGILRSIIIRAGHRGLGLVLRLVARDGYLGSMRTVHFAHWAFLNNGSRLLFFSNFDHSWGSYLDDFIEKAHAGLTLAWGCGVGFPPTRFLVYDGASHGRQFKAWALASRAVSRFWYSAYPDLTVDQVERNNRIANGLRQPSLSTEEAKTWMLDL
jgi:hypothetical protein